MGCSKVKVRKQDKFGLDIRTLENSQNSGIQCINIEKCALSYSCAKLFNPI